MRRGFFSPTEMPESYVCIERYNFRVEAYILFLNFEIPELTKSSIRISDKKVPVTVHLSAQEHLIFLSIYLECSHDCRLDAI